MAQPVSLRRGVAVLSALALLCGGAGQARAADYFIPGQSQAGAPVKPRSTPRPRAQEPLAQGGNVMPGAEAAGDAGGPPPDVPLPAPPELPALARGETPPAAVIGVIGVPDIMRVAIAAQQIERTIGERRRRLDEDAQKEQSAWRDMQQSLTGEGAKLSPDERGKRERALQERITNAQRSFRDRNRVIQEAAQYAVAQIERTLVNVIRQVADSRGMNLVLHRSQVALNVEAFDITQQVADQLNKVLPTVQIPPDGVSVEEFAKKVGVPAPKTSSAAPSEQKATPAAAKQ
jgi:Skp family chaperone for outer membrane proteins